jgi:hypothetical protein
MTHEEIMAVPRVKEGGEKREAGMSKRPAAKAGFILQRLFRRLKPSVPSGKTRPRFFNSL